MKSLYIPHVEQNPKPGIYQNLMVATQTKHPEYPNIWDLLPSDRISRPLWRDSPTVLCAPASISPGLRELVAAYTSRLNNCAFCTKAHAAAASELLGSEALVAQVLADLETSPLENKEKLLLRFVGKIANNSAAITAEDMEPLRAAGWDDEAICTITTSALFNFYNSSHAVFVRPSALEARLEPDEVPEMLRSSILSFRAFDQRGMMVASDLAEGKRFGSLYTRSVWRSSCGLHPHSFCETRMLRCPRRSGLRSVAEPSTNSFLNTAS